MAIPMKNTTTKTEPYSTFAYGKAVEFDLAYDFTFKTREEYLRWVEEWKAEYARHTRLVRAQREFYRGTHYDWQNDTWLFRNREVVPAQWEKFTPEHEARHTGLKAALDEHYSPVEAIINNWGQGYAGTYRRRPDKSKARMLLAMRKQAKLRSWELKTSSLHGANLTISPDSGH